MSFSPSGTTAASTEKAPFSFPPYYHFPPFFTKQKNSSIRARQLQHWSALILDYCTYYHLFRLAPSDAVSTPLFHNATLNRIMSLMDVREVFDWMASAEGGWRAEWVDGGGKSKAGEGKGECWIYWRRPEEWGSAIADWVDATGQKNTVLTLYELTSSEASLSQDFHHMPVDLLQKSLQTLVKRGKAQIFGNDDSLGVKFF